VQTSWPEAVERVAAFLREAGAEARLEEFESGASTAEDAARAAGCSLAQIVKSIVVVCDEGPVLTLLPGDRRADTEKIARAAGSSAARIARANEVESATGFRPGAVGPFALPGVDRVFVDRTLLGQDLVWVGAGSPAHVAVLHPTELVRLTRAQPIDAVQEPEYHSSGGEA
jgi:prolyl-tRNA editing enzyme YbaK/EbsC (Cys-tRNA(Pro) deacylase)